MACASHRVERNWAARECSSRQSVQRVADLLADDGIVRYDPNPDHARSPLLALTPEGERIESSLTDIGYAWASQIAEGLPASDLERTVATIRELTRRLDT